MVTVAGTLIVSVTLTVWLAVGNPGAETVMVDAPKLMPLTTGCVAGAVAHVGIVMLALGSLALVVSLLTMVTTNPVGDGAGILKLTGNVPGVMVGY
jgi:hypothetical protein